MENPKNDQYYTSKIITDMEFIIKHMKDVSIESFGQNEVLQDSMLFRLIQISENAKRLSDSFKNSFHDIPWVDIYGLRNRIVHEYGHVAISIIYETLEDEIPDVYRKLKTRSSAIL